MSISYVVIETVIGFVLIAATDRGLCSLRMGNEVACLVAELREEFPAGDLVAVSEPYGEALGVWVAAIREYLEGKQIDIGLPLEVRAAAFQMQVWSYLLRIQVGETRSYAEVAEGIGQPTATRAVASACARNPVGLAIPCHRVIRGDGTLGGYRWGMGRK